ncbi:hypothetical protein EVAR_6804_1 [Eumeta japonica]|uniref:Uncharacterized protein n=1 Tax=Eumeta variegata TaxID=151549 RepID=A0A4C1U638_EUMVA|nr:hypothetical protein EVAR_6804_1 [Eumeta japonica]
MNADLAFANSKDFEDSNVTLRNRPVKVSSLFHKSLDVIAMVATSVATKLGVALKECRRGRVSAERLGPVRRAETDQGAAASRPLVVRLSRRSRRDDLLAAVRVRCSLTTKWPGFFIKRHELESQPPDFPRRFEINFTVQRVHVTSNFQFRRNRDNTRGAIFAGSGGRPAAGRGAECDVIRYRKSRGAIVAQSSEAKT